MKWTTANVKHPNYVGDHEIYVGAQTGSFKKLTPANDDKAFSQTNLQDLSALEKDAGVTALAFGNEEKSEILIGRAYNKVHIHTLFNNQNQMAMERTVTVKAAPVVGVARFDDRLIAGFANGKVQTLLMDEDSSEGMLFTAGDDISHLRQCGVQRNLIATGGKGRQNNLKVFDIEAGGKQVFSSKNLPNDELQLEVPVWDSDVGFLDASHMLATCSRYGYVRVYDTRQQRRPVQLYASADQMGFATLATHGHYIYTGSTTGAMKAFDMRRMKNFVHTYKGFTGAISDLCLDESGKYLASASLDRYVRVHHADSCVLLYQCYVKSKATRVLIRSTPAPEQTESSAVEAASGKTSAEATGSRKRKHTDADVTEDKEYEEMFDNMQTIRESSDGDEQEKTERRAKSKKHKK